MSRLDGKVCVITGAAGGIGIATGAAFKREGATVVGVDLRDDSPGVDLALACDVADEESVRSMYDEATAEFGWSIARRVARAVARRLNTLVRRRFTKPAVIAGFPFPGWRNSRTDCSSLLQISRATRHFPRKNFCRDTSRG